MKYISLYSSIYDMKYISVYSSIYDMKYISLYKLMSKTVKCYRLQIILGIDDRMFEEYRQNLHNQASQVI